MFRIGSRCSKYLGATMPSQHRPKTMLTFMQQSDCQLPWRYDLRCVVLCQSKTSTHLLESLEAFAAMTDVPQTPSLWSLRFIVQWLQCVFLRVCLWKNMEIWKVHDPIWSCQASWLRRAPSPWVAHEGLGKKCRSVQPSKSRWRLNPTLHHH